MSDEDTDAARRRDAKETQRLNAHRALGRYIDSFSWLIYWMKRIMVFRLSFQSTTSQPMAHLVLGAATARHVGDAFFAMCRLQLKEDGIELDEDEKKVASKLEKAVLTTIEERNDVVHGDWLIGYSQREAENMLPPQYMRIKPSRKQGAFTTEQFPDNALDKLSDDISDIGECVISYGNICIGAHWGLHTPRLRISDLLVIKRKKGEPERVVRDGPMASQISGG